MPLFLSEWRVYIVRFGNVISERFRGAHSWRFTAPFSDRTVLHFCRHFVDMSSSSTRSARGMADVVRDEYAVYGYRARVVITTRGERQRQPRFELRRCARYPSTPPRRRCPPAVLRRVVNPPTRRRHRSGTMYPRSVGQTITTLIRDPPRDEPLRFTRGPRSVFGVQEWPNGRRRPARPADRGRFRNRSRADVVTRARVGLPVTFRVLCLPSSRFSTKKRRIHRS